MRFLFSFALTVSLAAMAAPSYAADGARIRVGSSPVVSSAGIYLANDQGYFREQGLDVEVVDFTGSGAPMTALLASSELDVAAGNLTAGLMNALAQGAAGRLVLDKGHIEKSADYINLLVRKDHLKSGRFKGLKDLKGFKLGLTALDGVSQQILTERFLEKGGLSEKDIEYVKLTYAEMNAALKTGHLDGTVQLEPFVAQATLDGFAEVVAHGADVYDGQQSAALIYSNKFLKSRDLAVKFALAYLKGVRDYNRSLKDERLRGQVIAILKKHMKIEDKVWEKMSPVGIRDDGALNIDSLTQDLAWYKRKKFVKGDGAVTALFDTSIAAEAVKKLDGK